MLLILLTKVQLALYGYPKTPDTCLSYYDHEMFIHLIIFCLLRYNSLFYLLKEKKCQKYVKET